MTRIGLIAAAAMLAGVGMAAAQTSTPSTSPSAAGVQGKCWDSAAKQVRNMSGGSASSDSAGTRSGTTTGTAGGTTTGTGSSTGSTSSSTGAGSIGSTGANQARPTEAMGLPDCK